MTGFRRICLAALFCLLLGSCAGGPATPSPTPTLPPTRVRVVLTAGPPAVCPQANAAAPLPDLAGVADVDAFEAAVLAGLNGGGAQQLAEAAEAGRLGDYQVQRDLFLADLTGDGVAEFLIKNRAVMTAPVFVYTCDQGQYTLLLELDAAYFEGPTILAMQDLNQNGLVELAVAENPCGACTQIRVFEWDGRRLQNLVRAEPDGVTVESSDAAGMMGSSTTRVEDIDGDGLSELVVTGGLPNYPAGASGTEGPYREKTLIYRWDGQAYTFHSLEYAPPNFIFEAVQDGDLAASLGEYDRALAAYQEVLSNDQLHSWSAEAWQALVAEKAGTEDFSPPDPARMPFNPEEYALLSAYARYRMMLTHLARGDQSTALLVYQNLVQQFPPDTPPYGFAQLAKVAWDTYRDNPSMAATCAAAVAYAETTPQLLAVLGGQSQHSWKPTYTPADICPFE